MDTKLKVVEPVDAEATAEEMASAVRRISAGTAAMLKAGLNRRALCVLLRDSSGVGIGEIKKVLVSLADLAKDYTDAKKRA